MNSTSNYAFDYSKLPAPAELMNIPGKRVPKWSRNLCGSPMKDQYGRDGIRKIVVKLNPSDAEAMVACGWPVSYPKPENIKDGDTPVPYIVMSLFPDPKKGFAPPVVAIDNGRGLTYLGKDTYDMFDTCDLEYIDVKFHAYYSKLGNVRIAIDKLYAKIHMSELDKKLETLYPNPDIYQADYEEA